MTDGAAQVVGLERIPTTRNGTVIRARVFYRGTLAFGVGENPAQAIQSALDLYTLADAERERSRGR